MLIGFLLHEIEEKRITPLQRELLAIVDFCSYLKSLLPLQKVGLKTHIPDGCSSTVLQVKFEGKWYSLVAKNPSNTDEYCGRYQSPIECETCGAAPCDGSC